MIFIFPFSCVPAVSGGLFRSLFSLFQKAMKQLNTIAGPQHEAEMNHDQWWRDEGRGKDQPPSSSRRKGIIPSTPHANSGLSRRIPLYARCEEIGQKLWKQVEEPPLSLAKPLGWARLHRDHCLALAANRVLLNSLLLLTHVISNFSLKQLTSFKSSLKELVHPN